MEDKYIETQQKLEAKQAKAKKDAADTKGKGKRRAGKPLPDDAARAKRLIVETADGAAETVAAGTEAIAEEPVKEPVKEPVTVTPPSKEELSVIRRMEYPNEARAKRAAATVKKRGQKKRTEIEDMDLELMDIINADFRGFKCRRLPIQLYFSSDKVEGELNMPNSGSKTDAYCCSLS